MEPKDYILTKIEGEYAYLKDTQSDNEIFIALALLPIGADIGSKTHFEMFEYPLADYKTGTSKSMYLFFMICDSQKSCAFFKQLDYMTNCHICQG